MSMNTQSGASMIEVLVAFLVVMAGLLGMAGMQVMAVSNTEIARYNMMATLFASNMAAKMQVNRVFWGELPPEVVSVNGATVTGVNGPTSVNCVSSSCSASEMAYYDLRVWGQSLLGSVDGVVAAQGLPGGNGQITCSRASFPVVCAVTIFWTEKNIALLTGTENGSAASGPLASGTSSTHSYQTLVSIPR